MVKTVNMIQRNQQELVAIVHPMRFKAHKKGSKEDVSGEAKLTV